MEILHGRSLEERLMIETAKDMKRMFSQMPNILEEV